MPDLLLEGDYWLGRLMIQRALGIIYLLAFANALNQFPALSGDDGLTPVSRILKQKAFRQNPSIFHWYYSDRFLKIICWIGIFLSVMALTGVSESGSIWLSMSTWFLLWALYQSIVNVGQTFYGFGWETMLLEVGFYAIFLGPSTMGVPVLVIWMIRWMLFRVEFGAGLIKMRGDACWRNLTCLNYHHETQPLPNPLSRYFHLAPEWYHKIETGFNHFVQLIVVWGLFFPQPVASISAVLIIASQAYLVISGNYSWLNWLTLSLGFSGISDGVFGQFISFSHPETMAIPAFYNGVVGALAASVVFLSIKPVRNMLSPEQMMNFSFNPVHLVNTYGAFGRVTKTRYEIIIEGTVDKPSDTDAEWEPYEFKAKPGNPSRIPPQVSPYHLRLDWQIWFAAMSSHHHHPWFGKLLIRLLEGDDKTIKLLKHNPFPGRPPAYIRARLFRYRYTTSKEQKETGQWWKREFVREYFQPISLDRISRGRR